MKMFYVALFAGSMFLAPIADAANRGDTLQRVQISGAYCSGAYQDLFHELLGVSAPEIRSRIDSVFHQLFYGNDRTERLYYRVGSDMAYIKDILNDDVRTEGMSYGMMICVQMNRKDEFDCLWKWAKTYMQFKHGPHKGYFAWHCRPNGVVLDSTAASDGEEWFVMSLFFAAARWGNGTGIFDYRSEAQFILNTMLRKEADPGHDGVTNMFSQKERLVSFVPEIHGAGFTDPSYQLPHYYELWSRWSRSDNQFWCDAATASRNYLWRASDSITGLFPDYSHFDGTPINPWSGGHDDFRFDAWRVAMNVAIDYTWFAKDAREVTMVNRLLSFFLSQGVDSYGNQYTLTGKKLSNDHSPGLVGMNAVAALASTNKDRRLFVQDLWKTPTPKGLYRYYDGMLYMLAMLQVSGNFRIYDPMGKSVPACSGN